MAIVRGFSTSSSPLLESLRWLGSIHTKRNLGGRGSRNWGGGIGEGKRRGWIGELSCVFQPVNVLTCRKPSFCFLFFSGSKHTGSTVMARRGNVFNRNFSSPLVNIGLSLYFRESRAGEVLCPSVCILYVTRHRTPLVYHLLFLSRHTGLLLVTIIPVTEEPLGYK